MSGLWKLNLNDLLASIINAVVIGVGAALFGIVSQTGFDVFNTDWAMVFQTLVNVGFIALVTSLFGRFSTDDGGRVLGRWG